MIMFVETSLLSRAEYYLATTWIREAWKKTCANRDMAVKNVGIDGSKDDNINIKGIENYHIDSVDDYLLENKSDSFEYDLLKSA